MRKDVRDMDMFLRMCAGVRQVLLMLALAVLGSIHATSNAADRPTDNLMLAQDASRGITLYGEDPTIAPSLGDYHALLIGIDDYEKWPSLGYAEQDATDIGNILVDRYGFSPDKIVRLAGEDATRGRILREMRDLLETLGEDDKLLIFYAGHGQLDPLTGEGYWIPADGELTYEETWIAFPNLRTMLTAPGVRAKNVVLVTDSCYGGAVAARSGLTPGLLEAAEQDYEQYRQKLIDNSDLRSRQVLASGGFEEVPDRSEFARLLKEALRQNAHPLVDFEYLFYTRIAPYLVPGGQQRPLLARLVRGAEHDGQFVLVRAGPEGPAPSGGEPPAPSAQQAVLTVRSNVLNDQVYIDGAAKGSTRLDLEIDPGSYLVRVEKAGYDPFEQRIELAAGESRVVRAQLVSAVAPPPQVLVFDGQPQVVRPGQSVSLEWQVQDAEAVEIAGLGNLPLSGSRVVTPDETTTYVLTARGADGMLIRAELPVRVESIEPRILSFEASPTRIRQGQSTRLRWATEHASRVEIIGIGLVPPSGSKTLSPERSSHYQLVAVNDEGVRVERLLRIVVESATSRQLRGVYTIQQKSNSRYMDAHEGSNDSSVVTRDRQNNDTQRWILTPLGNNVYTIQQKSNSRYMDAHEGSNDNSVVTRDRQNNDTQRWILTPLGNNAYTIQQKSNGRYMDAHEGSNDNSVVTRNRQNNDTQRWIIRPL